MSFNSKNVPRLAIIGCGYIVEFSTVPALRRLKWLPCVLVDPSAKRLETVGRKAGGSNLVKADDWKPVAHQFDAAIVAVPHVLHGPIGIALLEAGKHVFMEKPLATTAAECRAMTEAADRNGVILSVGVLRRYLQIARWTKALVESGTLGTINRFEAREGIALDSDTGSEALLNRKAAGGGVFLDTGAHTLDLLQWWLGDLDPVSYRDDSEGGVEADCLLECRFAPVGTGSVELSRTRDLRNMVRIEGSKGFVEVRLAKNEVLTGSPEALAFKYKGIDPPNMKPQYFAELFDAEFTDFKASVSQNKQVGISGWDGTKSVEIIERAYSMRRPLVQPWEKTTHGGNDPLPKLPAGSKVLVTGATGFIGGRLVERLIKEQGAQVRCIIRNIGRATRLARLPVEIMRADLSNASDVDHAVQGMDNVFHCAFDVRSRSQNTAGLRNLIDACQKHSIRRLVHVSTFSVYAPFPDGLLTEETRNGDQSTPYVNSKLELEKIVFESIRDRGVPATIVQPTIVYGPYCKPWTNAVAEMLIHGKVILPDNGDGLCNAIYIDDLIDGLVLAALSPSAVGERFIMSGPEDITWATFFGEFARSLGANPPIFWSQGQISKAQGGIIKTIRFALTDPRRLIKNIVRWNSAREILQKGLDAMPGALKKIIMNYYFGGGGRHVGQIFLPDRQALALYNARASITCEKARSKLGYNPRIDFAAGMALTSEYLAWAYTDIAREALMQQKTKPILLTAQD